MPRGREVNRLVAGSANFVVRAGVKQMNFQFGAFPRSNKFKDEAEVVTNGTGPASLDIAGEFAGPQRGMTWLSFELMESGRQSIWKVKFSREARRFAAAPPAKRFAHAQWMVSCSQVSCRQFCPDPASWSRKTTGTL